MISVRIGDILGSKAQTLVNTVNCVGVMGKGIALEFKQRFPEMYRDYVARCDAHEMKLGRPYLFRSLLTPGILNFPTKNHWRNVTKLSDIAEGMEYLLAHYKEWGITSIAFPPLGCGQGQLEWRVVGPTLYRYLKRMDIPVELYAPYGTPHEELQTEFLGDQPALPMQRMPEPKWIMPGWVAILEVLKKIEDQPYHHAVGRTTFQKIAYVVTREGIPTGLNYERGSYGPFSSDMKIMEAKLVNNGLLTEDKLGNMIRIRVGSTFEDARKAYSSQLKRWESVIDKTADLFMRVDTSEAEIVATVLFAAAELPKVNGKFPTEIEVLEAVMKWKELRRPKLDRQKVAFTLRNLAALKWLDVRPSKDLPLSKGAASAA